jgi:hypothetical protein
MPTLGMSPAYFLPINLKEMLHRIYKKAEN